MHLTQTLRPLLTASTLALACLSAQAALVNYTGVVDFGPLDGSSFSGSFSYADPAADFDGWVALDSFTLDFNGETYTLATADDLLLRPPVAWFAGGSFLGVDYVDEDSFGTAVYLTAGFFDLSEASFSYQVAGSDQGFGGFTSFTTVPEPTSLALLLAGVGLLGATRRRQAC